ncbi:unnamed protein product [Lymnaea stagnalis]|uniref:J domain-containing protein n=1 Tax=Lymnaea stagnalis TaxID=6523 RepID=A0AAV2I1J8_LYMST
MSSRLMFLHNSCKNGTNSLYSLCFQKVFHQVFESIKSDVCSFSTKADHYKVLGVDKNATHEDIRAAFLKRSKECHPDISSGKSADNHQQFIMVNEAYTTLSKPLTRRSYDLNLNFEESEKQYNTYQQSAHTQNSQEESFYERPRAFYDLHSVRQKAEDEFYRKQPYYGIKGVSKISNGSIVMACFCFMLTGMLLHFVVLRRSFSMYKKVLDENDAKSHAIFKNAKEAAATYSTQELKQNLIDSSNLTKNTTTECKKTADLNLRMD